MSKVLRLRINLLLAMCVIVYFLLIVLLATSWAGSGSVEFSTVEQIFKFVHDDIEQTIKVIPHGSRVAIVSVHNEDLDTMEALVPTVQLLRASETYFSTQITHKEIILIERSDISSLVEEKINIQSGIVDGDDFELSSTDYLFEVSVITTNNIYSYRLKLLDTESGKVVSSINRAFVDGRPVIPEQCSVTVRNAFEVEFVVASGTPYSSGPSVLSKKAVSIKMNKAKLEEVFSSYFSELAFDWNNIKIEKVVFGEEFSVVITYSYDLHGESK